jgi:hypothetical protein
MRDPEDSLVGTALATPSSRLIDESAPRRLSSTRIRAASIGALRNDGERVTCRCRSRPMSSRWSSRLRGGSRSCRAGGYNTREIIERVDTYTKLGADAILSVTPYYNKPTQEGLYQHFRAIAESSDLGIILYNVPGRTSCNLEPATVERLSKSEKIIGIKEASGNISQIGDSDAGWQLVQDIWRRQCGPSSIRDRCVGSLGGLQPSSQSERSHTRLPEESIRGSNCRPTLIPGSLLRVARFD